MHWYNVICSFSIHCQWVSIMGRPPCWMMGAQHGLVPLTTSQIIRKERRKRKWLMVIQWCKYYDRTHVGSYRLHGKGTEKKPLSSASAGIGKCSAVLSLNSVLSLKKWELLRLCWSGRYFLKRRQPEPSHHEWERYVWKTFIRSGWSEKGVETRS